MSSRVVLTYARDMKGNGMSDTAWTAAQLTELRHHWGSAYLITCPARGRWIAERRDGKGIIRAEDAGELRDMIVADYRAVPVPR
jgi:hypothetical protein